MYLANYDDRGRYISSNILSYKYYDVGTWLDLVNIWRDDFAAEMQKKIWDEIYFSKVKLFFRFVWNVILFELQNHP